MKRREAVAGMAASLMVLSPKVAFGSNANTVVAVGVIGTGNRGCSKHRLSTGLCATGPAAASGSIVGVRNAGDFTALPPG